MAIDYEIKNGENYTFNIKCENEEEKPFVINNTEDAYPKIEQNKSYEYALISYNGIDVNKCVTIDYGTNTENYYSLDNGVTWIEYTGTFKVYKDVNVIAKSNENGTPINRIARIKLDLAQDAIGPDAYDSDISTGFKTTIRPAYINLDSSLEGEKLRFDTNNEYNSSYAIYDENNSVLSSGYLIGTVNGGSSAGLTYVDIPKGAKRMSYFPYNGWGYLDSLLEITVVRAAPEIEITTSSIYPIITASGINKATEIEAEVVLKKSNETDKKLVYSINDENNYLEYNDGEKIKITRGQTIYARSVYGERDNKSEVSTYTYTIDMITDEAYDGDLNTDAEILETVDKGWINVDSSAIGKKIKIEGARNCCVVQNGPSGSSLASTSNNTKPGDTLEFQIPEGTTKLYFTTYARRLGNLYISEIIVQQ